MPTWHSRARFALGLVTVVYLYTVLVMLPALMSLPCSDLDTCMKTIPLESRAHSLNESRKSRNKPAHDDKCRRIFHWSMLDDWEEFEVSLPDTFILKLARTGGPIANGTADMAVTVHNPNGKLIVIDTTGHILDLKDGANLWHRHTALYGAWIGVQVARHKYNLGRNRTVFVHDCSQSNFPVEWRHLGELSCDRSLIDQAEVVIYPPLEGLLWDLAWDFDFECRGSKMFQTYASLFVDKSTKLAPTKPLGCWISRRGSNVRTVANLDDILGMMHEIFPRVKEIVFAANMTVNQTSNMIQECRVLFGVHGAGHTNTIYARPGVSVVEIIGRDRPAYFRNINMLLDQYYQSIVGDSTKGINDEKYNIDLDEARAALVKGRDRAAAWIEEHGYW